MNQFRRVAVWCALALAMLLPVWAAAQSPLLEWRDNVYIIAGFSGVIALALLLIQPLLAANTLPGMTPQRSRRSHQWVGSALVVLVIVHVLGLWITSPPDVIDALLFASPTPFSAWGVIAMWALFATACLAMVWRRIGLKIKTWRISHKALALLIVATSALHAILIEGTMEWVSKSILCVLVCASTLVTLYRSR